MVNLNGEYVEAIATQSGHSNSSVAISAPYSDTLKAAAFYGSGGDRMPGSYTTLTTVSIGFTSVDANAYICATTDGTSPIPSATALAAGNCSGTATKLTLVTGLPVPAGSTLTLTSLTAATYQVQAVAADATAHMVSSVVVGGTYTIK